MHLISGLNLATLIEIYTQINTVDSLVDLVKRAVENGQESLCYCNELSSKEILEEFLGGNEMIKLLRVDHRLLHGQVAFHGPKA